MDELLRIHSHTVGIAVATTSPQEPETDGMVLRIERASRGQLIILRLSGRIQSEHVEELKAQMEGDMQKIVLDLADVKLVDRDAVCFLANCEANGVQLKQCSPYIRDWIARERVKPQQES